MRKLTFRNKNSASDSTSSQRILRTIKRYNEEQLVQNEHRFGALKNDSVVIIVQVHNRLEYLKHLVTSLAQAKDISNTLVIFSHDYYDDGINDLVQSIDFCKVLQVNFFEIESS